MLGLVIFCSPWTESYDYQPKDSSDDFKMDFTCFSLVWSVFEYPKKTLEKPELSKQHIESRLQSVIIDGKLEKKWANGQTFFYINKLENEQSHKTDTSILAQKCPSLITCRTP